MHLIDTLWTPEAGGLASYAISSIPAPHYFNSFYYTPYLRTAGTHSKEVTWATLFGRKIVREVHPSMDTSLRPKVKRDMSLVRLRT